jgi:hypothetical protein
MAAIVQPGTYLKFRVWCISSNQASVNTFWFRVGILTGAPTVQDMAEAFDNIVAPLFLAIIGSQTQYRGTQCYNEVLPLPLPGVWIGNAAVGSGGGINMATQATGINTWLTNFTGVSLRGRTYWPFPTTTEDAAGGVPTAGYITALTALCNAILNVTSLSGTGGSTTLHMALMRGKNKDGILQPPVDMANFMVRAKWATQKRRGEGYGRPNSSPI